MTQSSNGMFSMFEGDGDAGGLHRGPRVIRSGTVSVLGQYGRRSGIKSRSIAMSVRPTTLPWRLASDRIVPAASRNNALRAAQRKLSLARDSAAPRRAPLLSDSTRSIAWRVENSPELDPQHACARSASSPRSAGVFVNHRHNITPQKGGKTATRT